MSDGEGTNATTVIINDREGNPHDWVIEAIPGTESFELLEELGELVGDSVGKLIQGAAGFLTADNLDDLATNGIDGDALGDALSGFIRRLKGQGGHKFLLKLLNHTFRDGKRIHETVKGKRLVAAAGAGDVAAAGAVVSFDQIGARNLKEMIEAAVEVTKYNYADFFAGFERVGQLSARMKALTTSPVKMEPAQSSEGSAPTE